MTNAPSKSADDEAHVLKPSKNFDLDYAVDLPEVLIDLSGF